MVEVKIHKGIKLPSPEEMEQIDRALVAEALLAHMNEDGTVKEEPAPCVSCLAQKIMGPGITQIIMNALNAFGDPVLALMAGQIHAICGRVAIVVALAYQPEQIPPAPSKKEVIQ